MSDCLNWINSFNTVEEAPISNYLYSKDYFKLGLKKFFFHRFEKRSAFTWIAGPLLEFKMISRELCHNQARAHNSMLGSRKKKESSYKEDSPGGYKELGFYECARVFVNFAVPGNESECLTKGISWWMPGEQACCSQNGNSKSQNQPDGS